MNTRDRIENLLKENENGLTTREIAVKMDSCLYDMERTLDKMFWKDRVHYKIDGNQKTWFDNNN